MRIENDRIILEKISEGNPARRKGEIHSVQSIERPKPATGFLQKNAPGEFSSDLNALYESMKAMSSQAAEIQIA